MNEITTASPPGLTVSTFWVETSRVLKEKEMEESMGQAALPLTLPDGTQGYLGLSGLFTFRAHHTKGKDGVLVRPNIESLNHAALKWGRMLSLLPTTSLSLGQRISVKILQCIPEEPTGLRFIDMVRQIILDAIIRKSLWLPITTVVSSRLKEKADSKTIF